MTNKQRVLLLGATGETGGSILKGLLNEPQSFEVEALVRPSSVTKPAVKALAARGVNIRVADIAGPLEELIKILAGIDVLISAIDAESQLAQLQLATAAKKAGVKRFVPCAFTTVAPPGGVMALRDQKEEVYQHVRKLYLPYTIIDVGFWHQISFPTLPSGRVDYAVVMKPKVEIYAGGAQPTILIDLNDIGPFVALIIKDPRTLNNSVIAYGDVLSQNEIFEIMEALSGEKITREYISADAIIAARAQCAAANKADPKNYLAWMQLIIQDYSYSKYVRGDNTPEYAKYLGYLDATELYPDFRPMKFAEFARELLDGKMEKIYPNLVLPEK
ncbi:hypothetical protein B0H16DRAFT_1417967 [Mycena metata]|uniref:NmrA-like domain-containing protein n=1 Tax=Mycena metata TaxID=1033252 RepID=A0AAD7J1X5_9AGAR|nr:hypothetical protein B0H16DRAFT_1417967 [Mycena metata]